MVIYCILSEFWGNSSGLYFKDLLGLLPITNLAYTDANKSLATLVVKHYNDLLGRQSSERGRDFNLKVTIFYVGDLFCIHPGTMYANFQEKIFCGDFLENVLNLLL